MAKKIFITNRSFLSYLGLASKGFCMGASDVVPGVSGGTMAFILGIYEELIKALRSFDLVFLRLLVSRKLGEALKHVSFRFLMTVGFGILLAIFSLSKIISWLLMNQPELIWSFFFGLILASIFTISQYLKQWNVMTCVWALIGAIGAYLLVGFVPVSTPNNPWFLFMSGSVAICAMILPGISGSFILVLLGKYQYILDAVNNRDFFTLFLVAAGAGFGLIIFARFLNWLLIKYHDFTIAILAGLMLGSLRKVWPWKEDIKTLIDDHGRVVPVIQNNIFPQQFDIELIAAIALLVTGFFIIFFLSRCSRTENSNYS